MAVFCSLILGQKSNFLLCLDLDFKDFQIR